MVIAHVGIFPLCLSRGIFGNIPRCLLVIDFLDFSNHTTSPQKGKHNQLPNGRTTTKRTITIPVTVAVTGGVTISRAMVAWFGAMQDNALQFRADWLPPRQDEQVALGGGGGRRTLPPEEWLDRA